MLKKRPFHLAAVIFSLALAACTTSTTPDTNSCAPDPSVDCSQSGTVGYSCDNGDSPLANNCSDDNGVGQFCCDDGAGGGGGGTTVIISDDGCSFDSTVTASCTGDSVGYSCPSGDLPSDTDASLNCSDDIGTGEFCCSYTGGGTCSYDAGVACSDGDGYSCSGSDNPQDDFGGITCSDDVGTGQFCCVAGDSGGGGAGGGGGGGVCGVDSSVDCTASGTTGYSCTDGAQPDPSLNCSDDVGTDEFCCDDGGAGGAGGGPSDDGCTFDPSVTSSCTGDSVGYSCPGSDLPSDTDSSLNCSDDIGTGEFCCSYTGGGTCSYDPSLSCDAGDGYSCTGSDNPQDDFGGITCSDDQGTGSFCCVAD